MVLACRFVVEVFEENMKFYWSPFFVHLYSHPADSQQLLYNNEYVFKLGYFL